jgi:precorrin-2 dehydrogenase/sirohydrochlorin ferrochelatase
MRTHPVFLRLEGRPCVIVGGDAAAAAKAVACAEAGAVVRVVAAELCSELAALVAAGRIDHRARPYRSGDLAGAFLAYASTREPELVARLVADAEREHVLLNVVDTPDACTFIAPAVVDRGDLKIAVGTGGASPGLATALRRRLEGAVGPEYGPFVAILGAVRRALGADGRRGEVLAALLDSPLLELIRQGRRAEVETLLARVAGSACTLDRLGVTLGGPG